MTRGIVGGVFLALLLADPVQAKGVGEGDWELGIDFGITGFSSDVAGDTGGTFTARGGYHFTDLFGLEYQGAASVTQESGNDIVLQRSMVNAVFSFHPGDDDHVPYLLIGVGTATLTYDLGSLGEIEDSSVAYQAALGDRFFFGRDGRVAFRVEWSFLSERSYDEPSLHTNLVVGFAWAL